MLHGMRATLLLAGLLAWRDAFSSAGTANSTLMDADGDLAVQLKMRSQCCYQGTVQSAPAPPSGVAAFVSAHCKTPYITPSMNFPLGKG